MFDGLPAAAGLFEPVGLTAGPRWIAVTEGMVFDGWPEDGPLEPVGLAAGPLVVETTGGGGAAWVQATARRQAAAAK